MNGPYPRGLITIDIGASGRRRDPVVITRMHQGLYEIMTSSLDEVGIEWCACHHEDRGDAVLAATMADSIKDLVEPLTGQIRARLDDYNTSASADAAMRLRVAVHAGWVWFVRHGDQPAVLGETVNHLFRIADASAVKRLAKVGGDLTVAVSDKYFHDIVSQRAGMPGRDDFQPVWIDNKETRARVWAWVSPPPRTDLPRQKSGPVRTTPRPGGDDASTEREVADLLPRLLDDADPGEPGVPRGM